MKPIPHSGWIAATAITAVLATACGNPTPVQRSSDSAVSVADEATDSVTDTSSDLVDAGPTSVPRTDADPPDGADADHDSDVDADPTPSIEIDPHVVTVSEIGVSTVLPSGWTLAPGGGFTDGESQLSAFAVALADVGDDSLDGFEPVAELTAGDRVWELHTQQTGELIVGLAITEIGDRAYGVILEAPGGRVEYLLETVVIPALEAFQVAAVPVVAGPFGNTETNHVGIDGQTIEYLSAGTGRPTVVLEAGLGNGMASWAGVVPGLVEHARVFTYDRPGYGGSDLTESPRDGATMVEDLRHLLTTTGHEPPYLLVGHSFGGTLMDLFARTHPDEVAGLVLVDSRHHEFTERCVAQFGPAECDVPTDEEVAGVDQPIVGEWRALPYTEAQLDVAPPLSDMPFAVIVAGIAGGSPQTFELWRQTQQEYADQITGSHLIVAGGSAHGIPAQQPELIIDTVLDLIGASR